MSYVITDLRPYTTVMLPAAKVAIKRGALLAAWHMTASPFHAVQCGKCDVESLVTRFLGVSLQRSPEGDTGLIEVMTRGRGVVELVDQETEAKPLTGVRPIPAENQFHWRTYQVGATLEIPYLGRIRDASRSATRPDGTIVRKATVQFESQVDKRIVQHMLGKYSGTAGLSEPPPADAEPAPATQPSSPAADPSGELAKLPEPAAKTEFAVCTLQRLLALNEQDRKQFMEILLRDEPVVMRAAINAIRSIANIG